MFSLHAKANFGRFQPLVAGGARSTLRFITHSSAYGLVLNVAGYDYRAKSPFSSFTPMISELPKLNIAIGVVGKLPDVIDTYELIHRYGNQKGSAQVGQPGKKIYKNILTPSKVEYLYNIDMIVCIDGNQEIEELMRKGLKGEHTRYGVPFAGTNSHFFDFLEEKSLPAKWLTKFDHTKDLPDFFIYSTLWVNRPLKGKVTSNSELFSMQNNLSLEIPPSAWVSLPLVGESSTYKRSTPKKKV